jgi:hypothetical protein
MRTVHACLAVVALALTSPATADEAPHRQLGAHVHGQGTLDIAIEGKKVEMELVAPGADIVGFEHEAESPDQKLAVEKAKATLDQVLTLFKLPKDANCGIDKSSVEIRKEEHHHHDGDADGKAENHDEDEDTHDAHGEHGGHSEFHAVYSLTCATPASLTALETTYFNSFAGAQALNVSVVAPKGQSQMQLTREKTLLDLAGLM